ncbi:MAG: hypothetical protein R3C46_12950 [Hyphomonadaceae bacterium]
MTTPGRRRGASIGDIGDPAVEPALAADKRDQHFISHLVRGAAPLVGCRQAILRADDLFAGGDVVEAELDGERVVRADDGLADDQRADAGADPVHPAGKGGDVGGEGRDGGAVGRGEDADGGQIIAHDPGDLCGEVRLSFAGAREGGCGDADRAVAGGVGIDREGQRNWRGFARRRHGFSAKDDLRGRGRCHRDRKNNPAKSGQTF